MVKNKAGKGCRSAPVGTANLSIEPGGLINKLVREVKEGSMQIFEGGGSQAEGRASAKA